MLLKTMPAVELNWAIYAYTHVTQQIFRDLSLRFQGLMAHDLGCRGQGTKASGSRCRAHSDASFSCGMEHDAYMISPTWPQTIHIHSEIT